MNARMVKVQRHG